MIPLTLRSNYSLMWGTAFVSELCSKAKKLGYKQLALTDDLDLDKPIDGISGATLSVRALNKTARMALFFDQHTKQN